MKKKQTSKKVPIISLRDLTNTLTPFITEYKGEIDKEWKRDIEEDKESFLMMNKEYKIEIDWDKFDELQVQTLLAILFSSLGYSILHLHKADKVREDGADLIVKGSKDDVAIAVKIKPGNKDRQQLHDLSKRKEEKKIYIYLQTPVGKFIESMSEHSKIVDYWDVEKLNKFFVEKNVGFTCRLVFDCHELSNTINETRYRLFEIRDKCLNLSKKRPSKLDLQSFNFMWRLKDEAVSFYKTNQNVIHLIERPIDINNNLLNEHFTRIFLEYMDVLNIRLKSYMYFFELFYEKNQDLVNNSIISYIDRSQWRNYLLQYRTDYSLTSLLNELNTMSKEVKKPTYNYRNKRRTSYLKEISKNNDVWSVMETRVRSLMGFGCGIEAIIDDIKSEFVESFIS